MEQVLHSQLAPCSGEQPVAPLITRARSASNPIKTVFHSAKKAIQYQFIHPHLQPSSPSHNPLLPSSLYLHQQPQDSLNTHQTSPDILRFKSSLFSPPSNPQISVDFISRQILDPMTLLQLPSRELKLPNVFPCEKIQPHSTVPPTRPTRSDRVDPDLIAREIPVILSSLVDQSIKKRSHRRGWTNHRAKNNNSPVHSPANSDMFGSGQQTLATSENTASYSRSIDSRHSVDEELRDYPTASSSTQSLQSCYHTNVDSTQLPPAYPINEDNKENLDIEDLTTPTLKSCERFEDDNSITPCQTFSVPNLTKGIQLTPRMIYEEYQRKFNQEEIIIKSKKPKISPSHPSTRPAIHNDNHGSLQKANNIMSSATALGESCLSDTSLEDPSDESFESFGDDQFFGPPLSSKLPKSTRQRISPLLSTFPLPPTARSGCPSSNFQRTPSPKQLISHDSKIVTPENMVPRVLIDCDKRDSVKSRTLSPLVSGKPVSVLGSSSPKNHQLPSRPSSFQLQPSPYRHVEHASIAHDGPNHLESSTRLMQMFESFLESSPKGNNSLSASPRSALSRKSTRKFKLDESPLKKMSSLPHLSGTPPQPNMQHKLSVKRDTFGRHSHRTPATMIHNLRPFGLASEISKACSTGVDFHFVGLSPPDSGSLLSPSSSAVGPSKNFPLSLRDEHPSPASDSDDEPSSSPKTPFGNFFISPNHSEPYVPTFEPTLSRESFYQKLNSYTSLKSQTHSLEIVEDDGLIQRFPKMANSIKTNETSFPAPKGDETATAHASRQPQLKHKHSAVSLFADGIRSRFTTQRGPRDSLHYGELDGGANPIGPTDEGFDTSPETSNATSFLEHDSHQSRSKVAQASSATHLMSGRILFEESSRGRDLIENRQTIRRNDPDLSLDYSLNQLINTPCNRSGLEISQHTWGSSLTQSSYTCESEQEIIAETGSKAREENGPHDVQQILSPIRLYGKQQGVLETGNWKTNNLNFRSMKSQYQLKSHVSETRIGRDLDVGSTTSSSSRRDRTMTEETQTQRGSSSSRSSSSCSRSLEEEEAAEREQKESLMVYKIQEEDENQILSFEFNRLKRIFHNKALKSSKSKSKLSARPLVNLFNHQNSSRYA